MQRVFTPNRNMLVEKTSFGMIVMNGRDIFGQEPSNLCKIERNATVSLSGQALIMVPGEETQAMPDQCP